MFLVHMTLIFIQPYLLHNKSIIFQRESDKKEKLGSLSKQGATVTRETFLVGRNPVQIQTPLVVVRRK